MIKRNNNLQKNLWHFSETATLQEFNFNNSLENFFEYGLSGLVKENIQNSLDAKLAGTDNPVEVIIETGDINKRDLPGIDNLEKRINILKGQNDYTRKTIKHMRKSIKKNNIKYISFEDKNTIGLKYSDKTKNGLSKDSWSAYAYSIAQHVENDNEVEESRRGGSHGVGKIASNSASDIYLMYFSNCDDIGKKQIGGNIHLIEHEFGGKRYRKNGYFTNKEIVNNNIKYFPYDNIYNKVFEKNTRGLKIIIPFLRKGFDNEINIIKAVCDGFFLAILENNLVVRVNNKLINSKTIEDYVFDSKYYEQDISKVKNDEYTPFYIKTYKNNKPQSITVENKSKEKFKFKLYFDHYPDSKKGRFAIFRTIGMKIEDFRGAGGVGFATKPFIGVLIGDAKEDVYLKSLENEAHNKLSTENIKDETEKEDGTRFINNLAKKINSIIEEKLEELYPTDGEIDTKDVVYTVEDQFKKDLKKSSEKVKVTDKKTLHKIPGKEKEKRKSGNTKGTVTPTNSGRTRTGTGQDGGKSSDKKVKHRYKIESVGVGRVVFLDKEILNFDFSNDKNIKNSKSFDLEIQIIDGEGKQDNRFLLKDNYRKVVDNNTLKELNFENNKIKDISIKNGKAKLNFNLKPNFNEAYKFVYYMEV